jgi:hypothetical protein
VEEEAETSERCLLHLLEEHSVLMKNAEQLVDLAGYAYHVLPVARARARARERERGGGERERAERPGSLLPLSSLSFSFPLLNRLYF